MKEVVSNHFLYNSLDGGMTNANGLYYMRARYYDLKLKRLLKWRRDSQRDSGLVDVSAICICEREPDKLH
ncbi:hypothetical protein [Paenibacillus amylolyticus]|uniref:hypothetical protein n=1 Tax=Paenibacillus amylolyticus TaxID=1451 RepID=UPI0033928C6D